MVNAEVPGLIVVVQRGGPGQGTIRHAQMDYLSATRGGGQGGYKNIVLAPASVQETYDFVQLGFHLADKYRNPVILLSDGILGQLMEALEVRKLEFEPLPQKTWAVSGRGLHEDGQVRRVISVAGNVACPPYPPYNNYMDLIKALNAKFQEIAGTEVRYETYLADDAELLLVAYGYVARVCKEAIIRARSKGLKVGMFRPMTLWPFPYQALKRYALQNRRLLVVEDSLGQLVDDVELAIKGGSKVSFLGMLARNLPIDTGLILPGAVLAKIEEVYQLGDEDE